MSDGSDIQYGLNFSKCFTTRTCKFPLERVRVRWITSISTLLHIYTSGFPIESKHVQLESGQQYWTTLGVMAVFDIKLRSCLSKMDTYLVNFSHFRSVSVRLCFCELKLDCTKLQLYITELHLYGNEL